MAKIVRVLQVSDDPFDRGPEALPERLATLSPVDRSSPGGLRRGVSIPEPT